MKQMRETNLNYYAEVTLSERGARIYNEHWGKFRAKYDIRHEQKKEGDKLKDQIWSLFQTFSSAISLGQESPFAECRMLVECDE